MSRAWWPSLTSAVGALIALAVSLKLPGRTSTHAWVDEQEALAPPTAHGFILDGLRWDLDALRADPRLDSLRALMRRACGGRAGLDAARCVSDELARSFPNAPPEHEFLDADYDPATDLESHLGGAAGHCTTRSSLSAAILLASGISARQVQIAGDRGHNVLEVFDEQRGWVIFDPTFGVVYTLPGSEAPISVAQAVKADAIAPVQLGLSPSDPSDILERFDEALFPDPWLYTRTGARAAAWPFRGRFVHVGARSLTFGFGQELARTAFGVLSISAIVAATLTARRRRRHAASR